MSNVIDLRQASPPSRHPRVARTRDRRPGRGSGRAGSERSARRWRTVAAIAGLDSLYLFGLVVAVPIGRTSVAVVIGLAFLLAVSVRALLDVQELARHGPPSPTRTDRPL